MSTYDKIALACAIVQTILAVIQVIHLFSEYRGKPTKIRSVKTFEKAVYKVKKTKTGRRDCEIKKTIKHEITKESR